MTTITGIATGDPEFSILVSTLQYLDTTLDAGLVETLDDPASDLTVFTPTNAAFADLAVDLGFAGDTSDTDAVTTFLTDTVAAETLLDIVLYHVSPTTQLSSDVANASDIATLNGETISPDLPTLVDLEPDLVDPSLISVDNIADNGVVHVIDKVLLPIDLEGNDAGTITDIVAASGPGFDNDGADFDILLEAVVTAGLDGTLADAALDATVFAPSDSAFIGLAQGLGYEGSDESGSWSYLVESLALLNGGDAVGLLTDVLTYHVAGESLQASQVLDSSSIATLQGGEIGVDGTTLMDGDPDLADPQIVATDIQASNGIIHVIDGVLLPVDVLQSSGAGEVDFIIGDDVGTSFQLGADNDFLDANGGNDTVRAGEDKDVVFGGSGDDLIYGKKDGDSLWGDDGNDELRGGAGRDMADGGKGADTVGGGKGVDELYGGNGADMVSGGKKDDMVYGGQGRDTLDGGRGDDWLQGGTGMDDLMGGHGADVFVFEAGSGVDTIHDFASGDLIDVSAFGFVSIADISGGISVGMDGTSVDFGNGDSVLLQGVTDTSLTDADFIFA